MKIRVEFIRMGVFVDCDIKTIVKLLILNAPALSMGDIERSYRFCVNYRSLCA